MQLHIIIMGFILKIMIVGLTSLMMITGCTAGLRLNPDGSTREEGTTGDGGLPGSPITPFSLTGDTSGAAIVTSPGGLTVFVRTGATAFTGNYDSENISISDPFLEAGIDSVTHLVNP